jgi:hypothetical protein
MAKKNVDPDSEHWILACLKPALRTQLNPGLLKNNFFFAHVRRIKNEQNKIALYFIREYKSGISMV